MSRSRWRLVNALAFILVTGWMIAAPSAPPVRWYKGNTHTHTLNSDGDSTPDEVVRWYRERGDHFLVLTDATSDGEMIRDPLSAIRECGRRPRIGNADSGRRIADQ